VSGVKVMKNTDYVLTVPLKIEQGRMRISVTDSQDRAYSSTIVEAIEHTNPEDQPETLIELPFISGNNEQLRIVISNEASNPSNPFIKIGDFKLFELGSARFLWTRYPRLLVRGIQKLFLTAIILPLAIIGLALLIIRKHNAALIILSVVPIYYFCVQSIVHTEYRYVLAVDYFLFALAAVSVSWVSALVIAGSSKLMFRKS
jgi:hypothetical protein